MCCVFLQQQAARFFYAYNVVPCQWNWLLDESVIKNPDQPLTIITQSYLIQRSFDPTYFVVTFSLLMNALQRPHYCWTRDPSSHFKVIFFHAKMHLLHKHSSQNVGPIFIARLFLICSDHITYSLVLFDTCQINCKQTYNRRIKSGFLYFCHFVVRGGAVIIIECFLKEKN